MDYVDPPPIRFHSFEEIRSRKKWIEILDAAEHKLLRIVGDYSFSKLNEIHCGLKNCRSPHMNGYVVETADGLETCIGNRCGTTHFGITWGEDTLSVQPSQGRARSTTMVGQHPRRKGCSSPHGGVLASSIKKKTAEIASVKEHLGREPDLVASFTRVLRNDGLIQIETAIDQETAEAMNLPASQRHNLTVIGRLAGTRAVWSDNNVLPGDRFASRLRSIAIPIFQQLSSTSLTHLNPRQRKDRSKELENAKRILQEAEALSS